jgi:hypothetical protein
VVDPPSGAALLSELTKIRREAPERISDALRSRRRRPLWTSEQRLLIIAADHPARGVLKAGRDPQAMGDRGELLRRLLVALRRPGVDGILATPDIVEDLVLLGALDEKLVFGSMNRGGLAGSVYELDDRFGSYRPEAIEHDRLDGGKMMVRVADDDPGALRTLVAAAATIDALAERKLPAIVEVFASRSAGGRAENLSGADALIRAIAVAAGLGSTSAYTWLKLPVVDEMERVLAATSLPTLLLGGDPGPEAEATFRRWAAAMEMPQVCGLVAGRTLLYPEDGDVARAVDSAAAIVSAGPSSPLR